MDDKQTEVLVDTIIDANRGFPELRKSNPELYEKIMAEMEDLARCRRAGQQFLARDRTLY
jgi:hypothetical protein